MKVIYNHAFYDWNYMHINIEDRGYQFGDGVYEVIRVYNGKPFRLDDHINRLSNSAKEIRMEVPLGYDELVSKFHNLIKYENINNGTIYIQVTRGVEKRSHTFSKDIDPILISYVRELPRPLDQISQGIKVITTEDIRWLRCDIKSLNLIPNVLAKQTAVDNGAKEAIFIRNNGIVTEGSSSNFFIVKEKSLYTHPADNFILNGITRKVVKELADSLGIPFIEKKFTIEEVLQADELFISGTTSEISPVIQVDNNYINDGKPGVITKELQAAFEKLII